MSEIKDQTAHFIAGLCFGLLVSGPIEGALAGLGAWFVREFTEWQLTPNRGRWPWKGHGSILSSGSLRDLFGWMLGGFVGGFV